MSNSLFRRVVAPVATPDDAATTADALVPHVTGTDSTVVAVHVIEKAGGAPDKASVAQREQYASDVFDVFADGFEDTGLTLETDLRYGTDVAATIIDAAHDNDASAIVFTPRGGSRWRKLLTGDVTHKLVTESNVPILSLSDREVNEA
ncbi:UspA domain protein (plasmid) [Halobacterium hubeiense]|uniref:UspA domain protein n=1 Tax=Halobacterium hubeiense TaxID=1407499 RepID=A0A0U5HYU8_9EURY|nr:universal stress protein [Halobacterium hubeiense]CQH64531.1 UspA domain protein [Halobacterium hubeiense]